MKKRFTPILLILLALVLASATGCDRSNYAASDAVIIEAKTLPQYIGREGTVILDMQTPENYAQGHVTGAVNYPASNILVSLPVPNSLASMRKVARTLGEAGVGNDTLIVIYDEGKSLNASRLWWTLLVYGYDKARVVDGGLPAIKAAGIAMNRDVPEITPKEFIPTDNRARYLAVMRDVRKQVDDPDPKTILLDVRTDEEFRTEGKIPGSTMMDHRKNFYRDGTFLDTRATRINFIERGIRTDNNVIVFCKTSMRAAPVFLRLWDAGYRNLKIYDGAWTEWVQNSSNPIERPDGAAAAPSPRDNS